MARYVGQKTRLNNNHLNASSSEYLNRVAAMGVSRFHGLKSARR